MTYTIIRRFVFGLVFHDDSCTTFAVSGSALCFLYHCMFFSCPACLWCCSTNVLLLVYSVMCTKSIFLQSSIYKTSMCLRMVIVLSLALAVPLFCC